MILQFDCRRFRLRETIIPPFTPSCLCVCWNPSVSRSVSHVEQGSWLLVGDVNGDVACLNCKTHELVGRYHAHDKSVQLGQGSFVNQVCFLANRRARLAMHSFNAWLGGTRCCCGPKLV